MSLAHSKNSFKAWFIENLGDCASDIAGHGADFGWPYITYTKDCVELYDKFRDEIWKMLNEDADSFGHKNPMEFVVTFNRIDMADSEDGLKNLLVWYACERVAHELEGEVE